MVPDGWKRIPLSEIAEIRTGLAKGKSGLKDPVSLPYLRVANVQDGHIRLDDVKTIEVERSKVERYSLRSGDVLMNEGGDFDKLGRGDVWLGQISPCLHQNHVFAVRPKPNALSSHFLAALAASYYGKSYFLSCAKKSTNLASMNSTQLKEFPVLLPPINEQEKIAQILCTWDKAIDVVEQLIENSKARKKVLMQKLLLGSERLPGYEGEWHVKHLEEVALITVSPVDKKSSPSQDTVRLCNYTDVYYNDHILDDMDFMVATASDNEIERFSLRRGDVVITKDSETPNDIAIPAYVEEKLNGVVCGYHLAIIRPDMNLADGQFLAYLFNLSHTRYYFFTLANGATRFGLGVESIRRASFSMPGINEQKAIANVIRTADSELSNLRKQLGALREEKKALMQQLLTGKRRVLPSKEA